MARTRPATPHSAPAFLPTAPPKASGVRKPEPAAAASTFRLSQVPNDAERVVARLWEEQNQELREEVAWLRQREMEEEMRIEELTKVLEKIEELNEKMERIEGDVRALRRGGPRGGNGRWERAGTNEEDDLEDLWVWCEGERER